MDISLSLQQSGEIKSSFSLTCGALVFRSLKGGLINLGGDLAFILGISLFFVWFYHGASLNQIKRQNYEFSLSLGFFWGSLIFIIRLDLFTKITAFIQPRVFSHDSIGTRAKRSFYLRKHQNLRSLCLNCSFQFLYHFFLQISLFQSPHLVYKEP